MILGGVGGGLIDCRFKKENGSNVSFLETMLSWFRQEVGGDDDGGDHGPEHRREFRRRTQGGHRHHPHDHSAEEGDDHHMARGDLFDSVGACYCFRAREQHVAPLVWVRRRPVQVSSAAVLVVAMTHVVLRDFLVNDGGSVASGADAMVKVVELGRAKAV